MKSITVLSLLFLLSNCSPTNKQAEDKSKDEHSISESIASYNLRKSIIDAQALETWPTILQIEKLTDKDSLVLYLVEETSEEPMAEFYIRAVMTSNLKNYSEARYLDDCKQDGTTLTNLKFADAAEEFLELEVFCDSTHYATLELSKNR